MKEGSGSGRSRKGFGFGGTAWAMGSGLRIWIVRIPWTGRFSCPLRLQCPPQPRHAFAVPSVSPPRFAPTPASRYLIFRHRRQNTSRLIQHANDADSPSAAERWSPLPRTVPAKGASITPPSATGVSDTSILTSTSFVEPPPTSSTSSSNRFRYIEFGCTD